MNCYPLATCSYNCWHGDKTKFCCGKPINKLEFESYGGAMNMELALSPSNLFGKVYRVSSAVRLILLFCSFPELGESDLLWREGSYWACSFSKIYKLILSHWGNTLGETSTANGSLNKINAPLPCQTRLGKPCTCTRTGR